ncbi:hypothetical protein O6H91_13G043000 [Diphasiastrum complanatum]|uniref:Uncharacterized protein n=1 Tax=Diphasiastrum complanatum TaxID=34168 RepID=A0ACC2BUE8_DIPCM|nr:hypothetical protein O6H91_13G043000 [Diphasiastrum complanatum]
MGNQLNCRPNNASKTIKNSHVRQSIRKNKLEQELLQQQALAFLLHQQQMAKTRLDRSMSQKNPNQAHQKGIPRSMSMRSGSSSDMNVRAVSRIGKIQFVLIHGGGTGAWCWYKSIALLEGAGFVATAIDLLGSGIDSTDPNTVSGLAQHTEPLFQFLDKLAEDEMVILVGHDIGGACISYAMEHFPHKISKAVFVAATMVVNGQSAFDVFASEVMSEDNLLPNAQQFVYANGNSSSPTAIKLESSLLKGCGTGNSCNEACSVCSGIGEAKFDQ